MTTKYGDTVYSDKPQIILYSARFAWRPTARHSPLFHFALSRSSRVLVQDAAARNISFLFTLLAQGAGGRYLRLARRITSSKQTRFSLHCNLSKLTVMT